MFEAIEMITLNMVVLTQCFGLLLLNIADPAMFQGHEDTLQFASDQIHYIAVDFFNHN